MDWLSSRRFHTAKWIPTSERPSPILLVLGALGIRENLGWKGGDGCGNESVRNPSGSTASLDRGKLCSSKESAQNLLLCWESICVGSGVLNAEPGQLKGSLCL